ncbi:MAG: DsbA family protein [Candidatus Omnitrophica bacterium]|nr:DsbA family protein [Candidatus Omnitrophota bacterium]
MVALFVVPAGVLVAKKVEVRRLPVSIENSPTAGSPRASVTLVEFTDFECPFCGFVQSTIQKIRAQYPDEVRLVFKNFPLPAHRNAHRAHLAALCAEEQGQFWEYRGRLFQNQRALRRDDLVRHASELKLDIESFTRCLDQEKYAPKIEADFKEGLDLGIQGTPAFFVNDRPLSGAQPFSAFKRLIDEELKAVSSG